MRVGFFSYLFELFIVFAAEDTSCIDIIAMYSRRAPWIEDMLRDNARQVGQIWIKGFPTQDLSWLLSRQSVQGMFLAFKVLQEDSWFLFLLLKLEFVLTYAQDWQIKLNVVNP